MDSQVGYHESRGGDSNPPPEKMKMTDMQLNKTELMLLRECNRESFYYRCLPFAFFGMAATYYAVKTGYLRGHPKFGPAFKMTGAAFAGWFLGKFSYRSICEDKFLNLENSAIGNAIRKKRGYQLKGDESEANLSFRTVEDYSTVKDNNQASYSGGDFHSSSGSLNFDRNEPSVELDDRDRPSLDSNQSLPDESQSVRQSTTYDELRRKNREDYENRQYRQAEVPKSDTYRRPWNPNVSEPLRRTSNNPQDDISRNTYGDSWDNPKFS